MAAALKLELNWDHKDCKCSLREGSKDQNYSQIGVIFVKLLDLSMKYKQGHKAA